MTYAECLEYLYAQLPMYQRIGQAAYKADLSNTLTLMKVLRHPERKFRSIHVAGTNGKGSTSHLLASIFQEAGYKTGLYTSPHLLDFRERIRLDGKMISQERVIQFVERHRADFEPIGLSFFEWSVGLAFDYFADELVDIAIIEVGMGGRLDSTNVLDPEMSIITNIGLDHQQYLGDDLDQIAREKAGIIKKGRPVVIGKSQRETEGIFRKIAVAYDAPIAFADQEFPRDAPPTPLKGAYQNENFQTVLVAIEQLQRSGWKIHERHLLRGFQRVLSNTGFRGRWETLRTSPLTICDVAHNKDGLQTVMKQLIHTPHDQLHLILGFVSDKAVDEILSLVPKSAQLILTEPSVPRAMTIERLSAIADHQGLRFTATKNVAEAIETVYSRAADTDLVFFGGSTFVVADAMAILKPESDHL